MIYEYVPLAKQRFLSQIYSLVNLVRTNDSVSKRICVMRHIRAYGKRVVVETYGFGRDARP